MNMLRPFLIATQFLTSIPVPSAGTANNGELGRSLLFYPLVGLIIGFLFVIVALACSSLNPLLMATLIITTWVLITGGLHLDGLADTADAWLGGLGSKTRTMEIMKDPRAGPMGVLALLLVVLLKISTVYSLLPIYPVYYLILPPMLGRCLAVVLLASTPYVREQGLGENMSRELNKDKIYLLMTIISILLFLFINLTGLLVVLSCASLFMVFRHQLLKRLGGCTGDTIGALIEICEVTVLLVLIAAKETTLI